MTQSQLNTYWQAFTHDHSNSHTLLQACITFARQKLPAADADRDDIASAAAWRAWAHFYTLKPTIPFAYWFIRVLNNTVRDFHRREKTRGKYESCDFICEPAFTDDEQSKMLNRAGSQREAIGMLLRGLTLEEAANELEISVRTLRTRLNGLKTEGHKYAN